MQRPTVLIISNDSNFARAITTRWQMERNSPAFLMYDSASHVPGTFDLVIVGGEPEFDNTPKLDKPIIHISRSNVYSPQHSSTVRIPEVDGWPELAIAVAKQTLERDQMAADLARLSELKAQLDREAALGRYVLEMRHSLNNALTSILGNSELMLLDEDSLDPNLRQQIETIRNMGMRMNEILQRFSSLQKEMELIGQQVWKKNASGAAAGV